MPSLTITTRQTRSGPRYVVRYRLGGRAYPVQHGGSFKRLREAKARRDLIGGELAAGRNPALALRAMVEAPPVRTLSDWAEAYQRSRVDYAAETVKNLASHLKAILPKFAERDPATITVSDVQEWIAGLALKPSSIRRYLATLRAVLDFAGVEPNPARDERVRLPRQGKTSEAGSRGGEPHGKRIDLVLGQRPVRDRDHVDVTALTDEIAENGRSVKVDAEEPVAQRCPEPLG